MEQRILLCADTNLEERERIRPEWAFANDTKKVENVRANELMRRTRE